FAGKACERRLSNARVCALWRTLVSLFHAPPGGATGKHLVCFEEPLEVRFGPQKGTKGAKRERNSHAPYTFFLCIFVASLRAEWKTTSGSSGLSSARFW